MSSQHGRTERLSLGSWVRAKRRIENNAGEIIYPGDVVQIRRRRRDGTFELLKPKVFIDHVEREAFDPLSNEQESSK